MSHSVTEEDKDCTARLEINNSRFDNNIDVLCNTGSDKCDCKFSHTEGAGVGSAEGSGDGSNEGTFNDVCNQMTTVKKTQTTRKLLIKKYVYEERKNLTGVGIVGTGEGKEVGDDAGLGVGEGEGFGDGGTCGMNSNFERG